MHLQLIQDADFDHVFSRLLRIISLRAPVPRNTDLSHNSQLSSVQLVTAILTRWVWFVIVSVNDLVNVQNAACKALLELYK